MLNRMRLLKSGTNSLRNSAFFLTTCGELFFNLSCISDYSYTPSPSPPPAPIPGSITVNSQQINTPLVRPTDVPTPNVTSNTSIRTIKPALAARGMACLMCHAQIHSNIITDFGSGDDIVFMGGPVGKLRDFIYGDDHTKAFSPYYSNMVNSWQTAAIKGTLYVPDVTLPAATLSSLSLPSSSAPFTSNTKLIDFLNTPYYSPSTSWDNVSPSAVSRGITPTAGNAPIVSVKTVLIRAPSPSEILSLAPQLQSNTSAFQELLTAAGPTLSGLNLASSASGTFTTNIGTGGNLKCTGDVIVSGPLYLKNTQLETNNGGCRFYVAGTVFIEGPITYVNDAGTKNLQITSSRAIILGINKTNLRNRLVDDNRNIWIREGSWWLSQTNILDKATEILNDFNIVNSLYQVKDAAEYQGTGYNTQQTYQPPSDPSNPIRASIDYVHLLLNAPIVESRYLGTFTGAIVAEIALFSVGKFIFYFDPSFSDPTVSILPQIPNDILVAQ